MDACRTGEGNAGSYSAGGTGTEATDAAGPHGAQFGAVARHSVGVSSFVSSAMPASVGSHVSKPASDASTATESVQAGWTTPKVSGVVPAKRSGHTLVAVANACVPSVVVVVGVCCWCLLLMMVVVISALRSDRPAHRLVLVGGFNGKQLLRDVHVLDTSTYVWSSVSFLDEQLPTLHGHSCIPLPAPNFLLLFGGSSSSRHLTGDAYRIEMGLKPGATAVCTRLTKLPHLPQPRFWHRCVVLRDVMILFGGAGSRGQGRNDMYVLKLPPATAPGTPWASLPDGPRAAASDARHASAPTMAVGMGGVGKLSGTGSIASEGSARRRGPRGRRMPAGMDAAGYDWSPRGGHLVYVPADQARMEYMSSADAMYTRGARPGVMMPPTGVMAPHGMAPYGMAPYGMAPHGMAPAGVHPPLPRGAAGYMPPRPAAGPVLLAHGGYYVPADQYRAMQAPSAHGHAAAAGHAGVPRAGGAGVYSPPGGMVPAPSSVSGSMGGADAARSGLPGAGSAVPPPLPPLPAGSQAPAAAAPAAHAVFNNGRGQAPMFHGAVGPAMRDGSAAPPMATSAAFLGADAAARVGSRAALGLGFGMAASAPMGGAVPGLDVSPAAGANLGAVGANLVVGAASTPTHTHTHTPSSARSSGPALAFGGVVASAADRPHVQWSGLNSTLGVAPTPTPAAAASAAASPGWPSGAPWASMPHSDMRAAASEFVLGATSAAATARSSHEADPLPSSLSTVLPPPGLHAPPTGQADAAPGFLGLNFLDDDAGLGQPLPMSSHDAAALGSLPLAMQPVAAPAATTQALLSMAPLGLSLAPSPAPAPAPALAAPAPMHGPGAMASDPDGSTTAAENAQLRQTINLLQQQLLQQSARSEEQQEQLTQLTQLMQLMHNMKPS